MGVLLIVSSCIIAFTKFDEELEGSTTYEIHKVGGIIAMILICMNWLVGFFRPSKEHKLRMPFVYVHIGLGVASLILGLVVCFLGIDLYYTLTGDSVKVWVGY